MMPDFERCVRAIAASILDRQAGLSEDETSRAIATFLLQTHAAMPDHLRIAIRWATLVFDGYAFLRLAKPFHTLGIKGQRAQIERWENAGIGPARSVITFYRTLATYAYYAVQYEDAEERTGLFEPAYCP